MNIAETARMLAKKREESDIENAKQKQRVAVYEGICDKVYILHTATNAANMLCASVQKYLDSVNPEDFKLINNKFHYEIKIFDGVCGASLSRDNFDFIDSMNLSDIEFRRVIQDMSLDDLRSKFKEDLQIMMMYLYDEFCDTFTIHKVFDIPDEKGQILKREWWKDAFVQHHEEFFKFVSEIVKGQFRKEFDTSIKDISIFRNDSYIRVEVEII